MSLLLIDSGIVKISFNPLEAHILARATPVFPLVGSLLLYLCNSTILSASSIMLTAFYL